MYLYFSAGLFFPQVHSGIAFLVKDTCDTYFFDKKKKLKKAILVSSFVIVNLNH